MSRENVESFQRAVEAYNRRDFEAVLEFLDPEIEWHPAVQAMMGGETAVYRGHAEVRELFRDVTEVFDVFDIELNEIRDLGEDRVVAIGRLRTRGRGSAAQTESPVGFVVDGRNGKAIRIRNYLDPMETLEAAGLRE
jgi:ketosteroid isomerase-like protein